MPLSFCLWIITSWNIWGCSWTLFINCSWFSIRRHSIGYYGRTQTCCCNTSTAADVNSSKDNCRSWMFLCNLGHPLLWDHVLGLKSAHQSIESDHPMRTRHIKTFQLRKCLQKQAEFWVSFRNAIPSYFSVIISLLWIKLPLNIRTAFSLKDPWKPGCSEEHLRMRWNVELSLNVDIYYDVVKVIYLVSFFDFLTVTVNKL